MLLSSSDVLTAFRRLDVPADFTAAEIARLDARPPEDRTGYCTFPTPEDSQHLSVLELRQRLGVSPDGGCGFFDHPWYLDEPFAHAVCRAGWHSIATAPVAASLDEADWHAESLSGHGLNLPRAVEVILMLFLSLTIREERFLLRKHTWTCDRSVSGRRVSVGAFGRKGVFLSSHAPGYKSRGLGICPRI
jgi:hypothetical protein